MGAYCRTDHRGHSRKDTATRVYGYFPALKELKVPVSLHSSRVVSNKCWRLARGFMSRPKSADCWMSHRWDYRRCWCSEIFGIISRLNRGAEHDPSCSSNKTPICRLAGFVSRLRYGGRWHGHGRCKRASCWRAKTSRSFTSARRKEAYVGGGAGRNGRPGDERYHGHRTL